MNWLLTSMFEAQNNEPDHPILQGKTNSMYNYKFKSMSMTNSLPYKFRNSFKIYIYGSVTDSDN